MVWENYRRIFTIAKVSSWARLTLHALGILQSLLAPATLLVLGLIATLALRSPEERRVVLRGSGGLPIISLPESWTTPSIDDLESISVSQFEAAVGSLERGSLAILLASMLVLIVLIVGVDAIRRRIAAQVVASLTASLRRQIHRQMYRLGLSALPTEGLGPIVDLFTREVDMVRDGIRAGLRGRWRWPVSVGALLILILMLSWELFFALALIAVVVSLAARVLVQSDQRREEITEKSTQVPRELLFEDLNQLRTVRVYGMESVEERRFVSHLNAYRDSEQAQLSIPERFGPGFLLLIGSGVTLAIGMIGWCLLEGRVEPATALTLLAAVTVMIRPIESWARMDRARLGAAEAASAIVGFLDRKPELLQNPGALFIPPLTKQIEVRDVTVEAPTGRRLLDQISFTIPAGTKTAVMGNDEDSKQALVCLLPRLLDPKSGKVVVDGLDVRQVTLESLRAQVTTVFQSDLVFSDTVTNNIGLGDPSYPLPRIIEAAKNAHAHHFIQDLPNNYDTYIGPLGHYLRIDEQYRIALARAWLYDPSLVIIEEPAAALDDEVKPLIADTIDRLARNRTIIFIAHRLSTIRSCDQVLVLHNGKIEALGTAKELQAQSMIFRHLQYLEFNHFAAAGEVEVGEFQA